MAKKAKNIVYKRLIRSYVTSVISISLVLVLVAAAAVFAAVFACDFYDLLCDW